MTRIAFAPVALALTLAASFANLAQAADLGEIAVRSTSVHVGDVDINQPAGAKVAVARISRAARELCASEPTPLSASQAARERACAEAATIEAVNRTGSQMLKVALSARLGAPPVGVASR